MVLCVEGWSRDSRGDQEVWSRGMSINLHSRGAKRPRQAPVLKPAAGEEAGRYLEDGYRTSSPGPTVTRLYDYTTSMAQGMPGKRGREEWKSRAGWGGVLHKGLYWA